MSMSPQNRDKKLDIFTPDNWMPVAIGDIVVGSGRIEFRAETDVCLFIGGIPAAFGTHGKVRCMPGAEYFFRSADENTEVAVRRDFIAATVDATPSHTTVRPRDASGSLEQVNARVRQLEQGFRSALRENERLRRRTREGQVEGAGLPQPPNPLPDEAAPAAPPPPDPVDGEGTP